MEGESFVLEIQAGGGVFCFWRSREEVRAGLSKVPIHCRGVDFFSGITIITHYINLNFRDDFCTGSSPICGGEFISDHYS